MRPSVAPRRRLESIPLSHRRGIDVEGTGGGGPAADACSCGGFKSRRTVVFGQPLAEDDSSAAVELILPPTP